MFARRSAARSGSDDGMENSDRGNSAVESSAVVSFARTVTSTIADGLAHTAAHWEVLLLGLGISFVLAIAGATNELLTVECGVSAPSTYNAFGYTLVAIFGGILMRRDTKNRGNVTCEEQEIFRNHSVANQGGDEHDLDDDDYDDDLTLDDDSPTKKKSLFSLRRNAREIGSAKGQIANNRSINRNHGSDSKLRPQYPFLCGMFTIHAKWYYYFGVSLIEAQAYYFIFLAFRYTSFTFVYVSTALAIPSAMLFTKLFMKRSYLWTHLIGCAICVAGIVVYTASDMSLSDGFEHVASSDHIKGDIFAIFGAILLGLDDVLSEIIVSDFGGVTEMLLMKGMFGALISIVQLSILERDSVSALFAQESSSCTLTWRMALVTAHVFTRSLDVAGEIQFLYKSEAALLNILLLTSDLFAAIFDSITIGLKLTPIFFFAFFLIVSGLVVYEAGPSPAEQPTRTPMSIEFKQRAKMHEMVVTSSADTDPADNLSQNVDGELT